MKKKIEFQKESAPKRRIIKVSARINVTLGDRVDVSSYESGTDLASVSIDKQMIADTDSRLREIKAELENVLELVNEQIQEQIENSEKLTNQFWADQSNML